MRIIRTFLAIIIILFLAYAYYLYQDSIKTLNSPLNKSGILNVEKGNNIQIVANKLVEQYGMKNAMPLVAYARLNNLANKIKAGNYKIEQNLTPIDVLNNLTEGKVIVLQFRIVEGKTTSDLLKQLDNTANLKHELTGKTQKEIAEILGIDAPNLEGQFLPNTYNYSYGDSDLDLLKRMHADLKNTLAKAWEDRDDDLAIFNQYEALILASIIEKETSIASEREKISGVFHRRLKQKMRLQTDPTVIYGLADKYTGKLSKNDLQTDTPYNTYTREGLPPTPIALVSPDSILAAVQPDNTENLYFVADGSGGHIFSNTYEEHQKAVQNWRKIEQSQYTDSKENNSQSK